MNRALPPGTQTESRLILPGKGMRGLSNETKALIEYAGRILRDDHPQTLRQLHYAIFSRREIAYKNDRASYQRLGRALSVARRNYRECELTARQSDEEIVLQLLALTGQPGIPPAWMADETREPEIVSVWKDAPAFLETVKHSYRRDYWQDQPCHCEVWSEKQTIMGAIRPIAHEYGLTLRVSHGYGSTGMEQQIGECFAGLGKIKDIRVFYLGDHDPSGVDIQDDIHRRVQTAAGRNFKMKRLAIHAADIDAFHLPPQAIKDKDARAQRFRRQHGVDAPTVELDALPAAELRKRIKTAVLGVLDRERWNHAVAVEGVEFAAISRIAEAVKSLPQLTGEQTPGGTECQH